MIHTKALIYTSIAVLISFTACKKTDPLPVFDDINTFYSSNKTEGSIYSVNVDSKADTIVTALGTIWVFPQGCFSASGNIDLKIKEIINPSEFVLTNSPNSIDSTFNKNALTFDIQTPSGVSLVSGKTFKVKFYNKGFLYSKVSSKNTNWSYDNSVSLNSSEPNADEPVSIFSNSNLTAITYNKLGTFATSENPIVATAKKTKLKIKIFGFTNNVGISTYVISETDNAVSAAKRISDSEFLTDSVAVGSSLKFISISFNQKYKYLGYANTIVKADSIQIPISLYEVTSQDEIKTKVQNYLK